MKPCTSDTEPGVVVETIRIKEQPGSENDLHHDERRDAVCCHTCLKALQNGMLSSPNADPAFTKNGFSNWKNAMEKNKGFQKHESSDSHMEAVAKYDTTLATVTGDIGDLLSERHALERSENRNVSNKEHLVNCIRWTDVCFVIHDDFIEMHHLERTNADQVVAINTKERPTEIQRARGQCYDGAATKVGEKTGVATQIKIINGKCLYAHCYGHASNLAVTDPIKSVQCITDALDAKLIHLT